MVALTELRRDEDSGAIAGRGGAVRTCGVDCCTPEADRAATKHSNDSDLRQNRKWLEAGDDFATTAAMRAVTDSCDASGHQGEQLILSTTGPLIPREPTCAHFACGPMTDVPWGGWQRAG